MQARKEAVIQYGINMTNAALSIAFRSSYGSRRCAVRHLLETGFYRTQEWVET
jgi:hypothetical protein